MIYTINGQKFTWDIKKSISNIKKHGITFQEAATVFIDDNSVMYDDDAHSYDEERIIIIGASSKNRLLFVCHVEIEDGDVIRLISARHAEEADKKIYRGGV